jgi:sporulation protein YlmC with PRC-barrel domain
LHTGQRFPAQRIAGVFDDGQGASIRSVVIDGSSADIGCDEGKAHNKEASMHRDFISSRRTTAPRAIVSTVPAVLIAGAIAAAGMIAAVPRPVHGQPAAVNLAVLDVAVVGKGYRVSKLMGRAVTNSMNERVGTIDDFVIGRDRVLFTILQVGGFLGIGSHFIAVPYQSLVLDDTGTKITLPGATKDELKKLAEFKYL